MQTFVWGEEFYTGVGLIDEQHHALVDLFNRLSETLAGDRQGRSEDVVQAAFGELVDYTNYHFAAEKGIMRAQAIDERHTVPHLKAHRDFTSQLHALWSVRSALGNPAETFLSFLTSWLCLHVLGVDQSLSRQIALIERGSSAAEAFDSELERPLDRSAEAMIRALRNTYHVVSQLGLELVAANRLLEARVASRTAELESTNAELVVANRKLEVYAQTDGLLGIANRKYFESRLHDEWNHAIRDQSAVGLLMIDVDYFKNYNDHYGHLAGDACLQAVARAAQGRMVRAVDLLARYGGEEFVVVLPHTSVQGATKVADSVRGAVSELGIAHAASSVADHVTVSIGVVSALPGRESTPAQALSAADRALYAAKEQGRNRVCVAAPGTV